MRTKLPWHLAAVLCSIARQDSVLYGVRGAAKKAKSSPVTQSSVSFKVVSFTDKRGCLAAEWPQSLPFFGCCDSEFAAVRQHAAQHVTVAGPGIEVVEVLHVVIVQHPLAGCGQAMTMITSSPQQKTGVPTVKSEHGSLDTSLQLGPVHIGGVEA
eukprot:4018306-Amphidinium_carterae.1